MEAISKGKAFTKQKCHTCRRQRIVCDGNRPSCRRCICRGVECLGYSAYPIRWVEPSSTVALLATRVVSCDDSKRKRGRPKLLLMQTASDGLHSTDADASDQTLHQETALLTRTSSISTIPSTLLPADYQKNRLILEYSSYYNDRICPDLVIVDSSRNPHRIDLDILPLVPEFMASLIVSVSAIHQVIRAQPRQALTGPDGSRSQCEAVYQRRLEPFPSFHHPLNILIYRHKSLCLRGLNRYLSEVRGQGTDLVVHAVAAMVLCEIQQSAFRNWQIHHDALRSILDYRGGFTEVAASRYEDLGSALRIFMLVDVMSAVTRSSSALTAHTPSQLAYIDFLPKLYCDGLEQGFPCPGEMIAAIIHTNNLRWIIHRHSGNDTQIDSAIRDLVCSIITFSPSAWSERAQKAYTEKLAARSARMGRPNQPNLVLQSDGLDWADLASAFQAATLLYCLRGLILNHGKGDIFTSQGVNTLTSTTLNNLLRLLHRIMTKLYDRDDPLGRFMFWPLFMAGMESACSSAGMADRSFLTSSLQELCHRLGDMSVLDAALFLQSAWRLRPRGGVDITWDALLERMGVHGVFFF